MGPGKPKHIVEEGRVFIDRESGMPLRLSSSVIDGPDFLKKLDFRLTGGPGPGGTWRADETKMDFVGRMIIYKAGGFTVKFLYDD
jgi:hypothetical protein